MYIRSVFLSTLMWQPLGKRRGVYVYVNDNNNDVYYVYIHVAEKKRYAPGIKAAYQKRISKTET